MDTLEDLIDELEELGRTVLTRAANIAVFEDKVLYLVKMEDILYNYTKDKSVLPIPCEEFDKDREELKADVKKLYFYYTEEIENYKNIQYVIKDILSYGKIATRFINYDFVATVINNKHEIMNAQRYIKRVMIKCRLLTKDDFIQNKTEALNNGVEA